jgi:hypothetical protein
MLMADTRIAYAIFGCKIFTKEAVRGVRGDNLHSSQETVIYANVLISYTFTVVVTQIFVDIKVHNFSINCDTTDISTHESWLCHSSDGYSSASHIGAPVSIPVQSLCYL